VKYLGVMLRFVIYLWIRQVEEERTVISEINVGNYFGILKGFVNY